MRDSDVKNVTWEDFVTAVRTAAEQSRNRHQFSDKLAEIGNQLRGRSLCWNATIEKSIFEREGDIPRTYLNLSPLPHTELGDTSVQIGRLHLPIEPDDVGNWHDLKVGDSIMFSATFGSEIPVFPTLEVWDSTIGYLNDRA